jgi:FtsP/CotA-like multicopper oxidase with cupredoxin domain
VGDTIQILVRNAAQSNFSMHPHGVFYNKTSEGAAYSDNSNLSTANHGFVAPGEAYTYRVSPATCFVFYFVRISSIESADFAMHGLPVVLVFS